MASDQESAPGHHVAVFKVMLSEGTTREHSVAIAPDQTMQAAWFWTRRWFPGARLLASRRKIVPYKYDDPTQAESREPLEYGDDAP